jgi:hypothetical protein
MTPYTQLFRKSELESGYEPYIVDVNLCRFDAFALHCTTATPILAAYIPPDVVVIYRRIILRHPRTREEEVDADFGMGIPKHSKCW